MRNKQKHAILIRFFSIIVILVIWEFVAKQKIFGAQSELIFPPIEAIIKALIGNFIKGYAGVSQWIYIRNSLLLLFEGLIIGIALAFILSGLSMMSNGFYQVFSLVVAICDLLPGVALLPIVIIIFGISPGVIVFLVVHAVLWPMSRNVLDGFLAVPQIYIEAGTNIGLTGLSIVGGGLFTSIYFLYHIRLESGMGQSMAWIDKC